MEPHADGALREERGFTLPETMIGVAILMVALGGVSTSLAARPAEAHVAAMSLQAAVAEARTVAELNGGKSLDSTADHGTADTGATVGVVPAGARDADGVTITVYRGRPVAGAPGWPTPDEHFAPITTRAQLTIVDPRGGVGKPPFAILVTSAGVASIARNYDFRSHSGPAIAGDPGCPGGEVADITVASVVSQTHELSCREASYDAATDVSPAIDRRVVL